MTTKRERYEAAADAIVFLIERIAPDGFGDVRADVDAQREVRETFAALADDDCDEDGEVAQEQTAGHAVSDENIALYEARRLLENMRGGIPITTNEALLAQEVVRLTAKCAAAPSDATELAGSARAIVDAIIDDLCDRRGLRSEWYEIAAGDREEIVKAWTEIAERTKGSADR